MSNLKVRVAPGASVNRSQLNAMLLVPTVTQFAWPERGFLSDTSAYLTNWIALNDSLPVLRTTSS